MSTSQDPYLVRECSLGALGNGAQRMRESKATADRVVATPAQSRESSCKVLACRDCRAPSNPFAASLRNADDGMTGHGRYHSTGIDLEAMAQSWSIGKPFCLTPDVNVRRAFIKTLNGRGVGSAAIQRIGDKPCLACVPVTVESFILAQPCAHRRGCFGRASPMSCC